jgi:hypothetical protein
MACDVARHEPYRACMGLYWLQINQRNPKCQNIDELRTFILQEWQQNNKIDITIFLTLL